MIVTHLTGPALRCPAFPYLPYPINPTLPYPTLPYPTLPYPSIPYPTLPYPTLAPYANPTSTSFLPPLYPFQSFASNHRTGPAPPIRSCP